MARPWVFKQNVGNAKGEGDKRGSENIGEECQAWRGNTSGGDGMAVRKRKVTRRNYRDFYKKTLMVDFGSDIASIEKRVFVNKIGSMITNKEIKAKSKDTKMKFKYKHPKLSIALKILLIFNIKKSVYLKKTNKDIWIIKVIIKISLLLYFSINLAPI